MRKPDAYTEFGDAIWFKKFSEEDWENELIPDEIIMKKYKGELECGICLEKSILDYVTHCCQKTVHKNCLTKMEKHVKNSTCPYCRSPFYVDEKWG